MMIKIVLAFAALLGSPSCFPREERGKQDEPLRVIMIISEGSLDDKSFIQSTWEGLSKAAKDMGIVSDYKEADDDLTYGPLIEETVGEGYDLIVGVSFGMSSAMKEMALKYPEQKFVIIDHDSMETPENLVGIVFAEEQASFLVGYIAGRMTETGTVGFLGGMDIAPIRRFEYGFRAGVLWANQDLKTLVRYTDSFMDVARGRSIGRDMYEQGADIVFHAAGSAGVGLIKVAEEMGYWAIGVGRDQNDVAPGNVLTSAVKRVDHAVYNVIELLIEDSFPGGGNISYGLSDNGVDIAASSYRHVPPSILEEISLIKFMIMEREIIVSATEEAF